MKLAHIAFAIALTFAPLSASAHEDMKDMKMGGAKTESSQAFDAVMEKMHKDMSMEMTGEPDVDFATGMLPHHQGAVDMAKVELQYGKDPELRKLAEDIIKSQETEIAFMKAWLAKHGK
jgi:uncharacterized protein (DUF305 family)